MVLLFCHCIRTLFCMTKLGRINRNADIWITDCYTNITDHRIDKGYIKERTGMKQNVNR